MIELVLHHYDISPFSEKVRLILGYKRLKWRSVMIPIIAPKPDLLALTGGYRRTPVLQVGADIYCDSALIARTLERLHPSPTLYPGDAPLAETFAAWADYTLFWTMIPLVMQPGVVGQLFEGAPPETLKSFAADRAAFTAGMRRLTPTDAAPQFATYLGRIERQLADSRSFLFGEAPTIADFSLAHSLWFVWRLPASAPLLAPYAYVNAWSGRMRRFGHGAREEITAAHALQLAAGADSTAPVEFDGALGYQRGEPIIVSATDYGTDPVAGTLVALTRDAVAVQRIDERAGKVVVHFPRIGFQIRRQERTG